MSTEKATYTEKEWVTEAGFAAVVVVCKGSHRCGYVGVPAEHPLHGVSYQDNTNCLMPVAEDQEIGGRSPIQVMIMASTLAAGGELQSPSDVFDVHGGLTFSSANIYKEHANPDSLWWFGYDCAHCMDGSMDPTRHREGPVRDLAYCVAQCEYLATQIADKTIPVTKELGNEQ